MAVGDTNRIALELDIAQPAIEKRLRDGACDFSRNDPPGSDAFDQFAVDPVDAKILDIIQHDASLSVAEIAERVGLSPSPCWRRIKRLEDEGIIRGRVTLLDSEKLGLGFEVFATVKLGQPTRDNLDAFEQAVAQWPEVVQCANITGREDYVLRVVASDIHAFDHFLREKLLALGLVQDVESHIVIRGVKNSTAVPLGLMK